MLLRIFEEEGGVVVVRNNSNNEQTPYISPKEPLTLPTEWHTDHQQTHHRPTLSSEAQPRFRQ